MPAAHCLLFFPAIDVATPHNKQSRLRALWLLSKAFEFDQLLANLLQLGGQLRWHSGGGKPAIADRIEESAAARTFRVAEGYFGVTQVVEQVNSLFVDGGLLTGPGGHQIIQSEIALHSFGSVNGLAV